MLQQTFPRESGRDHTNGQTVPANSQLNGVGTQSPQPSLDLGYVPAGFGVPAQSHRQSLFSATRNDNIRNPIVGCAKSYSDVKRTTPAAMAWLALSQSNGVPLCKSC